MKATARYFVALFAIAPLLAACHGGSTSGLMPQSGQPAAPASVGSANFTVAVPANGPQSLVVSISGTNGQPVGNSRPTVMNLSASTPGCSPLAGGALSCVANVSAPVGTNNFTLKMYAAPNGSGSVVSTTQATAVITGPGKTNCVPAAGSKLALAAKQATTAHL